MIWNPPEQISQKEFVGRRAFGSKVFQSEPDNVLHYRINVFMDHRLNTGLSIDRLGVRTACRKVLDLLLPLCDDMANVRSKEFAGWAQIKVEDIASKIDVTPAVCENNPYHAEIDRSDHTTKGALRSLAFELCVQASKHPFICRSGETSSKKPRV